MKKSNRSSRDLLANAANKVEYAAANDQRLCEQLDDYLELTVGIDEQTAMKKMRDTVQVFRNLAAYFHRSPKATSRLTKIQHDLDRKPLVVVLDCPTRWNSCRDMLERMVQLQVPMDHFFTYISTSEGRKEFPDIKQIRPRMEQWFAVRCLLVLLEPFGVATEVLSGADYPTLAIAFRCLRAVKSELQNDEMFAREVGLQGDHAFVHGTIKLMHVVRTTMLDIFRKRFSGMDLDLLWISYLDPRLTDMHMIMAEVALAKHAIISAAMEISKEDTLDASAMSDASVDTSPLPTPKKAKSSMYAAIFGQRMSTRPQLNEPQIDQDHVLRTKCESEFHMYLEQTTKVRDRHDPFEWWRAHAGRFPTLEKLARKWHCCVATSVPSERAFSTGQNTVTARRSSLGPELVRDLVFVAENYRDKKVSWYM